MVQQDMQEVNGGKYMYLTYVHLFGVKEVTECKNSRSGLPQNTE
jgi:hypothetical protein